LCGWRKKKFVQTGCSLFREMPKPRGKLCYRSNPQYNLRLAEWQRCALVDEKNLEQPNADDLVSL
jgi:hypothetical protein